MRKITYTLFSAVVLCAAGYLQAQELPRPQPNFYDRYPIYQNFFPFGVFAGIHNSGYTSDNIQYMDEEQGYRFLLGGLREHYLNFHWGGSFEHDLELVEDQYVLQDRAYLKKDLLTELDMYVAPTFWYWFATKKGVGDVFEHLQGRSTWLSDQQLQDIVEQHRSKFQAMTMLTQELGDRMIALVPSDEPGGQLLSSISVNRALQPFVPNIPLTTVIGSPAAVQENTPYWELLCYESYGRDKWQVRDQFLRGYKESPNTVLWNDILTGSYEEELTLPGLPDGKPTQGEVRLAFWQSVAGGAKGFMVYLDRLFPTWWAGSRSFRNQFGHAVKGNTYAAMTEVGRDLTAIGPLLLSCHPDAAAIAEVEIECADLRYLRYEGAALDCGILIDEQAERRFIVIYNNNIEANEKGVMQLPEAWLDGNMIFDMHALEAVVPIDDKPGRYAVMELRPGAGRIYLISDQETFAACRQTVLQHRVRNEIVRLDLRLHELKNIQEAGYMPVSHRKTADAVYPELLAGAAAVRRALNDGVPDFQPIYAQTIELIAKADNAHSSDYLGMANARFRRVADAVEKMDEIIAAYSYELFDFTPLNRVNYRQVTKNAQLMFEYRALIAAYFAAKNVYWRGAAGSALFYRLENYAKKAQNLLQQYQQTVDDALEQQRRPIKVLFITPPRQDIEFFETFSWLYRNFPAVYGRVRPDGSVVDRSGRELNLAEFDVIWFHALRFHANAAEEKTAEKILNPLFLRAPWLQRVRNFTDNGGNILLTGLFASYAIPLGLETVPADTVQDESSPKAPMLQGFAAMPGFAEHPIFAGVNPDAPLVTTDNYRETMGESKALVQQPRRYFPRGRGTEFRFDPAGFYTNGHHHEQGYFAEYTWREARPAGRVIACVYDSTLGALGDYRGILEYGSDSAGGKTLVAGAMPYDLSPGLSYYPTFAAGWKCFVRGLTYNMICYLGSKETFEPNQEEMATSKFSQRDMYMLPMTWKFRLDPDNVGVEEKWFTDSIESDKWQDIEIATNWESQGYDYNGYAWYQVQLTVPERFRQQKVILKFGGVDEIGYVYLNGEYVGKGGGDPQELPMGWATPFSFDITAAVKDDPGPHLLTVRVHDSLAAGGIWKPVYLLKQE